MQYVPLVGRILFSAVFIMFGFNHFTGAEMMAQNLVPAFMPAKTLIVYFTGIWIIAGGLMVLLGWKAKTGGLMLFAFLFVTALMVHGAGFVSGDMTSTAMFLKDMSMAGAGLLIYQFGSGAYSLDNRNAAA